MAKSGFWVGVVALVLAGSSLVRGQEPSAVGWVKVLSGSAFVVRDNQMIPAQLGQVVMETDGLRTGGDGRLGITLTDDTRVALGPDSELRLEYYAYAPSEDRLGFTLKIVRGIATYVSGQIAKLSPDSIRLETPAAIVGVRGTTLAFHVEP